MMILDSIRETINYAKKHGGKLTEQQLFERLIGDRIYKREEVKTFRLTGTSLDREALIKIEKAEKLAKIISKKFKDVLFLGITGSVAAEYPKKNDDIDLIIITKVNKLWITRLKLRLYILMSKTPHRKFGEKEKKDEFCFNLWLDEESLALKKEKQNLKNAVDLILIKPLINRNKTYEKFILKNDWAKKYVATGYSLKTKPFIPRQARDISLKKGNFFDEMVNFMMFWPQFLYMKKRIKKEKVGLHEAFFHH